MKRWVLALIVIFSSTAIAQPRGQIGEIPTEEDCLGLIAVLPTFYSEGIKAYYEKNPAANGRELVEKLQSLAEGGDKDAQFTYSVLLQNGYCVPQDICAARRYREKSKGGRTNWEQTYPLPPWPKDAEATCN